jgi:hypothetical protein
VTVSRHARTLDMSTIGNRHRPHCDGAVWKRGPQDRRELQGTVHWREGRGPALQGLRVPQGDPAVHASGMYRTRDACTPTTPDRLAVGVQGGDFTNGDGTGGKSIYGEKFAVRHLHIQA